MFSRAGPVQTSSRRPVSESAAGRPLLKAPAFESNVASNVFRTAGPVSAVFATIRGRPCRPAMPEDTVMISKWIAFLCCVVALGGCCASGSGCYAPATGSPVAWDGLGPSPDLASLPDDEPAVVADRAGASENRAKKPAKTVVRPTAGATAASTVKPHSDEWWARKEAEDRDADKALTRKLIICRGCSSSSPTTDEGATGSAPR